MLLVCMILGAREVFLLVEHELLAVVLGVALVVLLRNAVGDFLGACQVG